MSSSLWKKHVLICSVDDWTVRASYEVGPFHLTMGMSLPHDVHDAGELSSGFEPWFSSKTVTLSYVCHLKPLSGNVNWISHPLVKRPQLVQYKYATSKQWWSVDKGGKTLSLCDIQWETPSRHHFGCHNSGHHCPGRQVGACVTSGQTRNRVTRKEAKCQCLP